MERRLAVKLVYVLTRKPLHKSLSTEADIFVKVFLFETQIVIVICDPLKRGRKSPMPPAFLFLIPAMSNSWAGARFGVWSKAPRRPEVAAYTATEFCVNTLFSTFCRAISANRKDPHFEPKSHPKPFDRPRFVRHFREAPVSTDLPSPRQHRFSPKLQKRLHLQLSIFLATQSR